MKHLLIERIVMLLDFYVLKGEFIELYPKKFYVKMAFIKRRNSSFS